MWIYKRKSNDGIGWIEDDDDDDGWVTIEELPLSFTIWSKIPIEVKWVKKMKVYKFIMILYYNNYSLDVLNTKTNKTIIFISIKFKNEC